MWPINIINSDLSRIPEQDNEADKVNVAMMFLFT